MSHEPNPRLLSMTDMFEGTWNTAAFSFHICARRRARVGAHLPATRRRLSLLKTESVSLRTGSSDLKPRPLPFVVFCDTPTPPPPLGGQLPLAVTTASSAHRSLFPFSLTSHTCKQRATLTRWRLDALGYRKQKRGYLSSFPPTDVNSLPPLPSPPL